MQNTSKRPLGQRLSQLATTNSSSAPPLCETVLHNLHNRRSGTRQDMPNTTSHSRTKKTHTSRRFSAQQNRNRNGIKYRTVHLFPTLLTTSKALCHGKRRKKKKKKSCPTQGPYLFYPEPAEPASQVQLHWYCSQSPNCVPPSTCYDLQLWSLPGYSPTAYCYCNPDSSI